MDHKLILIISRDTALAGNLATDLKPAGFDTRTCKSGHQALEMVNDLHPSLVLAGFYLADMGGIELCWLIRQTSKCPAIPFILLSESDATEVELNGIRSGVDAVISAKTPLRHIIIHIEASINRVNEITHHLQTRPDGLNGTIPDFSLLDILQLLNLTGKTGTLTVSQNSVSGHIEVSNGEFTYAESAGTLGEEAVIKMATWPAGQFNFHTGFISSKKNIQRQPMEIILSCSSRIDELQSESIVSKNNTIPSHLPDPAV